MTKKKKIIISVSVISTVVLLGIMIPLIIFFCSNSFANFSLENMHIKNFTNYKSIGVGKKSSQDTQNKNNLKLAPRKENVLKLYGEKVDDAYEEIVFENDDGDEYEQKFYISHIAVISKFMFITYSKIYNNNIQVFDINNNSSTFDIVNYDLEKTFIIDLKTGNVYPTNDLGNIRFEYNSVDYNENEIYVCYDSYISYSTITYVYKIYTKNEKLVCETLVDSNRLNFNTKNILCDKYGNVFLKAKDSFSRPREYSFVLTGDNKIKQLNKKVLYKALNGYVYSINNTEKFNSQGELLPTSDTVEEVIFERQEVTFVGKYDNHEFYVYNEYSTKQILSINWLDETNYTVTKINIDKEYTDFAYGNKKIYFLNLDKIFYYDTETKTFNNLTSDYIFKSITNTPEGLVQFIAIDENINTITGLIDKDNKINISIRKKVVDIIYIEPIDFD